ncbi:hypothetical protein Dimus_000885 [Dionaea muscipula]
MQQPSDLKLRQRHAKRSTNIQQMQQPSDFEEISSDDEWITEEEPVLPTSGNWLNILDEAAHTKTNLESVQREVNTHIVDEEIDDEEIDEVQVGIISNNMDEDDDLNENMLEEEGAGIGRVFERFSSSAPVLDQGEILLGSFLVIMFGNGLCMV